MRVIQDKSDRPSAIYPLLAAIFGCALLLVLAGAFYLLWPTVLDLIEDVARTIKNA